MNIHQQYLQELHPSLVTGNENTDNIIAIEVKAFDNALGEIGTKYSDLRDDLRIEKTNTDAVAAHDNFTKKLDKMIEEPRIQISTLENDLKSKIGDSLSLRDDDPVREWINVLQAQSDRAELAAMTPEERREYFKRGGESGDPRLLRAISTMLKPDSLVSEFTRTEAKEAFVNIRFADELKAIAQGKEKIQFMDKVKSAIPFATKKLGERHKLDLEAATKARKEAHNNALRSRTIEEKLKAIKTKGFTGFQADYK